MASFKKTPTVFTLYTDNVHYEIRKGNVYSLKDGRNVYEISISYPFKDCMVNGRRSHCLPQHRALAAFYNIALD
jgi:hypothetical protein